jgi:alpha-glucosidase (family GH31 glycosyl hydrolase)
MRYNKLKFLLAFVVFILVHNSIYSSTRLSVAIDKGEYWWIGVINQGNIQPLKNGYKANIYANLYGNQAQPLLLSNKGKIIWSEDPFEIEVKNDSIYLVKPSGEFIFKKVDTTLRGAYLYASKNFFPPSGSSPNELMFTSPQYNTWIELLYNQNQADILKYASSIIKNNLPPGVIMVDDNWQENYGTWKFHSSRFPNPVSMIDSLHKMGFKVMLWICPFVSPDTYEGRALEEKGLLLKTNSGETKIVHWWNGYSSVLDLSNPDAVRWFKEQLDCLKNEYKVDGFKFDAGDPEYYIDATSYSNIGPNQQTELFSKIGLDYDFNEYRATWKTGGQPLAQRLRDKGHTWDDLQTLIPNILLQGIMGYPFTCPDMIGGGEIGSFKDLKNVDQDLIVRSAQCHVFMPMMQFSVAPWRVLDEKHFLSVKHAVDLRLQYTDVILENVKNSAQTGEPVVRYLEYEFPGCGYESITDQFMLGDKIMVAPILNRTNNREVIIPAGKWQDDTGKIIIGPKTIKITGDLNRLPFYTKLK